MFAQGFSNVVNTSLLALGSWLSPGEFDAEAVDVSTDSGVEVFDGALSEGEVAHHAKTERAMVPARQAQARVVVRLEPKAHSSLWNLSPKGVVGGGLAAALSFLGLGAVVNLGYQKTASDLRAEYNEIEGHDEEAKTQKFNILRALFVRQDSIRGLDITDLERDDFLALPSLKGVKIDRDQLVYLLGLGFGDKLSQHRFKERVKDFFEGVDLSELRLDSLDLGNRNFRAASLKGAKLIGTSLMNSDLEEAYLHEADLTRTKLRGAILRKANLGEAELIGADLRDADLRGAYLMDATLTGAKFKNAILDGASFDHGIIWSWFVRLYYGFFR